ncbi:hypothetical protein B6U83_04645 [Thermoplasmatales archaeon ex4484_36]|nr:MAG: hypothetical protein B6U83_04645 [Thermoplasmatales archaeon ex4484_36]RLF75222.1 MAG: hypothetical protein DRN42_03290 [Thermoplasmata archaeon]
MRQDLEQIVKLLETFWMEVKRGAMSVPRGAVATYGDLAEALGDRGAARALPGVLEEIKRLGDPFSRVPENVPLHRFVRSDGWIREECREALMREGVEVKEGRVGDLPSRVWKDFSISAVLTALRELQKKAAADMHTPQVHDAESFLSVDVSYAGRRALICGVLFGRGDVEEVKVETEVLFPYVPGYLFFREGVLIAQMMDEHQLKPDVILLDGHGVLHPRGSGLATHLGSLLRVPSIGVAKSLLVGGHRKEKEIEAVFLAGEQRGWAVKKSVIKKRGRRYIYISPGWGVGLEGSLKIYLKAADIIGGEPVERAHRCAARW